MKLKLALFLLFKSVLVFSQVGIGTTNIHASAIFEVNSNDQGVLLPKVNLSASNDISTISNPEDGLIVYNTAASGSGETTISANCLYVFNGSTNSWERVNKENEYGDFKYSMQGADHNGWVKLDGRLISNLSATAQTIASSLGFSSNLPDLTNRVFKQTSGALADTGGSNTTAIVQANLPDVNFTGTTNTSGNHIHDLNNVKPEDADVVTSIFGGLLTNLEFYTNSSGNLTTESSGDHDHTVTVNSGGNDTPLNIENPYFSTNAFIYLGY